MKRADILLFVFAAGWLLLMGNEAYQRNNVWSSSVSLWEDCLRNYPHDLAFVQLGNAYLERGGKLDIEKAIMCFQNALKGNNKNALAWRNCASAFMMKKETDLAKEYYKVALELDKDLPDGAEIGLLEKNKEVNIKWR
jgi:tetratricopeptide (TPR) repeat protein